MDWEQLVLWVMVGVMTAAVFAFLALVVVVVGTIVGI